RPVRHREQVRPVEVPGLDADEGEDEGRAAEGEGDGVPREDQGQRRDEHQGPEPVAAHTPSPWWGPRPGSGSTPRSVAAALMAWETPWTNRSTNAAGTSALTGQRGNPPGSGDTSRTAHDAATAGHVAHSMSAQKGRRKRTVPARSIAARRRGARRP